MKRILLLAAVVVAAACSPASERPAPKDDASPRGGTPKLQELAKRDASLVGYLYSADTPYIVASFEKGTLVWRTQGGANAVARGPVAAISDSDRACLGFKQTNPTMPSHGAERYLVCEALEPIKHSNSLPRSQDFSLPAGTLFLQYDPPASTGFPQLFYAKRAK